MIYNLPCNHPCNKTGYPVHLGAFTVRDWDQ